MILVVDDEQGCRDLLATLFSKAGYEVIQAADGMEALIMLENNSVDLVVSDILMPNLNGYALTARIRAKYGNIPIILTSGYLSPDAGKRMNGSVEFLPKPIDAAALIAMVQRLLTRSTVGAA